jgi:(1->4)-alpha-D-glucan 1-alpha-D-glucosylmutase
LQEDPLKMMREMLKTMEDGRIKLYITAKLLNYRKLHASLFNEGDYMPLKDAEDRENQLIAFCRKQNEHAVIVVSGRFFFDAIASGRNDVSGPATLNIPPQLAGEYHDILSGLTCSSTADLRLPLPNFFTSFPLMCLERING